jgi:acyl-CoA thioesterase-2
VPASPQELVELLDLETIDVNLFRGRQPDTRLQRVFGGQVAAQALVAAARTVDAGVEVHSMHSYFLRPGDTAVPIVYDVDRVRDGRSFSTRRVLARQHGRPIFALTASFQAPEDGFEHQDRMPEVPSPEECQDVAATMLEGSARREEWKREWSVLELRRAADSLPGGRFEHGDQASRVCYWIRVTPTLPDDVLVHRAAVTYISDLTLLGSSLEPHGEAITSPAMQVASLDHTVWFHRPHRADEWLLYDQSSPSAAGARGLAFGKLFARDGRLVASVAQEGLIRPRPQG